MRLSKIPHAPLAGLCLLAFGTGIAAPATAQTAPAATGTDNPGGDVVVTSLRRPERLRDIAASVTVFDRSDIDRAGIRSLRGIADQTPNFGLLDNYRPGLERFQLRGIITPQVGDPPLAFVVDGVTAPDAEFATQQLFDIERVEILRGAQGALYGRSAVGGTINIVTQAPTDRLQGWVSGAYENGDTQRVAGVVSGPIVADNVYFRLGGYGNRSDGLIDNIYLHTGADYVRDLSLSGMLRFTPGSGTTFDLRGQFGKARDGIGYYDAVEPSRASIDDFAAQDSENVLGINRRESLVISAKLEQRLGFATLTVAGGYFHTNDAGLADGDLTALPSDGVTFVPSYQYALDRLNAWTAEARLHSNSTGPFSWAIGSFYERRHKFSTFAVYDDPSGTARLTERDIDQTAQLFAIEDDQTSRTWALSGEASYKPVAGLEIAIAGRYDRDYRRSFDPRDKATTDARATFGRFQPKVSLSYRIAPAVRVYASYGRGFRSGGFNQYSPAVPRAFAAETTESYETGVKASAFGDLLTMSATLFRNDQTNAQITTFNPVTFTLQNVAIDKVRAQGAELDIALHPATNLRLRYAAGYTDSTIRAFAFLPGVVGAAMPYVPDFTMALSADWETWLGDDTKLITHTAWRLTGRRSFTLDFPDLKSGTHGFVDLRIGVQHGPWALTAFGENILNERMPEDIFGVFNGAVDLARQPNRPRRYGLELRRSFGSRLLPP
jgi:iron complex outermembrane receptor protein